MSIVGLVMNLLLAGLLCAALVVGMRLNRRLKALRDSHDGFAVAVRDLNSAAARAEQGLADLRAATDEAVDQLADRIEKGRALAGRLERLIDNAPLPSARPEPSLLDDPRTAELRSAERRLGALLAAAREARPERAPAPPPRQTAPLRQVPPVRLRVEAEDDLFDDAPLNLDAVHGGRR